MKFKVSAVIVAFVLSGHLLAQSVAPHPSSGNQISGVSGLGHTVVTTTGPAVPNDIIMIGPNGDHVDSGVVCCSSGGGSSTFAGLSGNLGTTQFPVTSTMNALPYWNGSAWVVGQLAYSQISGTPTLGTAAAQSTSYFDLSGAASTAQSNAIAASVSLTGSYSNPAWLTQLATTKLSGAILLGSGGAGGVSGVLPKANQFGTTTYTDQANTFSTGLQDMGAASFRPPEGTLANIPATCTVWQIYIATDQVTGANIYECTAANTWSAIGATSANASTAVVRDTGGAVSAASYAMPGTVTTPSIDCAYTSAGVTAGCQGSGLGIQGGGGGNLLKPYVSTGEYQMGALGDGWFTGDTGAANSFTLTVPNDGISYVTGAIVGWPVLHAPTGTSTLSIDNGASSLPIDLFYNQPVVAGDYAVHQNIIATFDAADSIWQAHTPSNATVTTNRPATFGAFAYNYSASTVTLPANIALTTPAIGAATGTSLGLAGDVKPYHLTGNSGTPASPSCNADLPSATCTVLAGSNDISMIVSIATSATAITTWAASTDIFTINFAQSWLGKPVCVVGQANAVSQALALASTLKYDYTNSTSTSLALSSSSSTGWGVSLTYLFTVTCTR